MRANCEWHSRSLAHPNRTSLFVEVTMADDQSQGAGVDEFEREPVPERALLGFKSFVGMYAGEHTAGTELMLGPLFVASGVSAFDLLVGLLVGNVLAVLSWTFLTAPIATQARLTLYCQLEKICGRKLVTLYNLANGVMFCFLAGAMITVSATAVGVVAENWVEIPMPSLNDVAPFPLPEGVYQSLDSIGLIDAEHTRRVETVNVGWIVASLAVGFLTAIVAVYGYGFVAHVANISAPWMTLVFLAFGLVALRQFIDATGSTIHSAGDLWSLATTYIWKGGDPLPGQAKFTFWHVMFFAWFCNMAMHIGMSDLSIFRYAKHSWYGLATASGMYLGHFLAWISASLLYAIQLHENPANTDVLPGPLAYRACGVAGLICVIIAGWTTANPTIYRAGLAFQAIMPRVSRAKVTFVTGMIAAVAGMFPAIAMKLLSFVAVYGMLLMPMGAVVFVDFYLMRKFSLSRNYAEQSHTGFNWAAGLTWFLTLGTCWALVKYANIQIFFVSLPGWFVAAALYIVLSKLYQRNVRNLAAC
jgi:purine-cytosine permease-like protein